MTQHTQQHSTRHAAQAADITAVDLWLHYYSVGGSLDAFELDAYLHGAHPLPLRERNLIALALNELNELNELIDDLPQRPKAEFEQTPLLG